MNPPFETEKFVDEAAAAVGLRLALEQRPGVLAAFAVLRDASALLETFPLPADTEPAPIFRPAEKRA